VGGNVAETIGSLADKLSIAELKIYHMREQAVRADVDAGHRERCAERLAVLELQRDDLAAELAELWERVRAGTYRPKVYRQFKMYNDPRYRIPQTE
jgi:hypothetical protein